MQSLPHQYRVNASAGAEGSVALNAEGLPQIDSAPPQQFGGPGDQWSPEDLLTAAVADCFILTFRAVATASKFDWSQLQVAAEGVLDRVDRETRFVAFTVRASLNVPAGSDPDKAQRLLEKAEAACLITNSLSAEAHLEADVIVAD